MSSIVRWPCAVSRSCLARASSGQGSSCSSPPCTSLVTMRLTLDLSSPKNSDSCAAVMALRASISNNACTADAEYAVAAKVRPIKPSSRTMLRDAARMLLIMEVSMLVSALSMCCSCCWLYYAT